LALYYFHLRDGANYVLDLEGRELESLDAVRAAALREARSLISHDVLDGRLRLDLRIVVETAAREIVVRLTFADAVTIDGL
jgi:hypothetical protein